MLIDQLPDAEDLWWSWVVVAASERSTGHGETSFDPDQQVLGLHLPDGSWLKLQRFRRGRTVLWGRSATAARDAVTEGFDPLRGAPAWTLSDAVASDRVHIGFLAWWHRGEWDTDRPGLDVGAIPLVRTVLVADPSAVDHARHTRLESLVPHLAGGDRDGGLHLVQRASDSFQPAGQQIMRRVLVEQIHEQMRRTPERPRRLTHRPPVLVQWARVNGLRERFNFSVQVEQGRLTEASRNSLLAAPARLALINLLTALHRDEASDDSGAWLFARVHIDGTAVRLERAFDSWPEWHHPRVALPGIDDLRWEMDQRAPAWRPAWASLLPAP